MLANIIISGITFIIVITIITFTIWTYLDTKRKYSHERFIEDRKQQRKEAQKRFKEKTRLGKK